MDSKEYHSSRRLPMRRSRLEKSNSGSLRAVMESLGVVLWKFSSRANPGLVSRRVDRQPGA